MTRDIVERVDRLDRKDERNDAFLHEVENRIMDLERAFVAFAADMLRRTGESEAGIMRSLRKQAEQLRRWMAEEREQRPAQQSPLADRLDGAAAGEPYR